MTGSDIKSYLADGWTILDVRPPSEANKARIVGAVEVRPRFGRAWGALGMELDGWDLDEVGVD